MDITKIAEITFGGLTAFGVLAAGAGYLYSQFKSGSTQEKKDTLATENQLIEYMKNQVRGFKVMVDDQNSKISTLTNELNTVKGQLLEKDKLVEKYIAILQNRNPEMETFMKTMLESSQRTDAFILKHADDQTNLTKALTGILTFMARVDTSLEVLGKDLKIEAIVTKQD